MPNLIDLTGKRFGRWTVIEKAQTRQNAKSAYWVCRCDCGNTRQVNTQSLRKGGSKSCGCLHYEEFGNRFKKHGESRTRLYNVWSSMRERCYCETRSAYKWYGANGITICKEWQDYSKFEEWALSNGYDPTAKSHLCTIDRIENNKGYYPDNCRFVDSFVQSNNQRKNIILMYNGESKSIAEWSRKLGWNYGVLYNRIARYGWSVEKALTTKPRDWSPGKCKESA